MVRLLRAQELAAVVLKKLRDGPSFKPSKGGKMDGQEKIAMGACFVAGTAVLVAWNGAHRGARGGGSCDDAG